MSEAIETRVLSLADVVVDLEIYPRSEWSSETVSRYAESIEAGEVL